MRLNYLKHRGTVKNVEAEQARSNLLVWWTILLGSTIQRATITKLTTRIKAKSNTIKTNELIFSIENI